jgi:hypothetical protein
MGTVAAMITGPSRRILGLAEALLDGVKAEQFATQPTMNGTPVDTNHPAFIYGHLALYPSRVLMMAGLDGSSIACPEHYAGLFGAGIACRNDPEGSIYPPMKEITERFFHAYRAAQDALDALDDAAFAAEHKGPENYKKIFPTLGPAANFMMNNHVAMHLGQMSAWRRCVGLGSAMK